MTAPSVKLRLVPPPPASELPPSSERTPRGSSPSARGADGEPRPSSRRSALSELDDDQLVGLALGGDATACEVLYRRHAAFAFNLGVRIAGSSTDIEDLVHDSFMRAFGNLSSLRNARAFRSWLGSIVVHAVRSRLRRGKLVRLFGLGRSNDGIDIDAVAAPEASPQTRAELAQVYALLRTLPADDRIAWSLRCVEGHDLKTAAALCDCSLATVKRRIGRAQRYIKDHFVATHDGSGERHPESSS